MKNVIKSKKQLSDKNIINAFLSDELEFGYTLVHNIHKSLVDINKTLRSACIPNETTKKSVISILSQQVSNLFYLENNLRKMSVSILLTFRMNFRGSDLLLHKSSIIIQFPF